jgi:PAS domain S-box-containing protein
LTILPENTPNARAGNNVYRRLFRFTTGLFQSTAAKPCLTQKNPLDDLPGALFILVGGKFCYINPAGVRLFGAETTSAFLGRSVVERIHPDSYRMTEEKLGLLTINPGTVAQFNARLLRMDGSSCHRKVTLSPTHFYEEEAAMVQIDDVTPEVLSRQALERYHIFSENVRDIMWFVRLSDGLIIEANRAAEESYGYTQEEFKGLPLCKIRASETRDQLNTQLSQASSQGITFETIHLRKSGEKFPVEVSSQGMAMDGEMVVLSLIRDISERKRAEEQIRKQMEENTQRTKELEAMTVVSFAMRSANTRAQMVPLLVEQAVKVTKAQSGALILVNENTLLIQAANGSYAEHLGRRISGHEHFLWNIIQSGQLKVYTSAQLPANTALGGLFPNFSSGQQNIAFAPLKAGPVTIGLLVLGFKEVNPIQANLTRLINAIAEMAGSALHRMSTTEMMEKIVTDRTRELEHIYQVSSSASTTTDLRKALQQALEQTLQAIGVEAGVIYILNEEQAYFHLVAQKGLSAEVMQKITHQAMEGTIPGWVTQHKESLILPDLAADPRSATFIPTGEALTFAGLPMRVQNRGVGMLGIIKPGRERFHLEEMMLLSFIADHIGLLVDHFRLYQQVEMSAVIEERSRVARELHDSVTQSLYSASLFASGALKYVEMGQADKSQELLVQLGQVTQQALKEMRLMVYELRSSALRSYGLAGALQNRLDAVECRSGIKASLKTPSLLELPEKLEEDLYRIVLEALNNALKHADASEVKLEINQLAESICLSISDNGRGFDSVESAQSGGVGLSSMRERASRWNGSLNIITAIGAGCNLVVTIPMAGIDERAA